jgi:hypothetical protein
LVRTDFDTHTIIARLQELLTTLQQSVQQPTTESAQRFRSSFDEFRKALEECASNGAPPTVSRMLEDIGASKKVGSGLLRRVQRAIEDNNVTPANAHAEITAIFEDVVAFHKTVVATLEGFANIGVEPDQLGPGECEVGVLIPKGMLGNGDFGRLNEELAALQRLMNAFSELAGQRPDSIRVTSIGASDIYVYIQCAAVVAAAIATALERIVALYKSGLEIRAMKEKATSLDLAPEIQSLIEAEVERKVQSKIDAVVKDLVEANYRNPDEGRKNEIANMLRISVRRIVEKIEMGFTMEVTAVPPEAPLNEPTADSPAGPEGQGSQVSPAALMNFEEHKALTEQINRDGSAILQLRKGGKKLRLLLGGSSSDGDSRETPPAHTN